MAYAYADYSTFEGRELVVTEKLDVKTDQHWMHGEVRTNGLAGHA
jgi:hypothetical protein